MRKNILLQLIILSVCFFTLEAVYALQDTPPQFAEIFSASERVEKKEVILTPRQRQYIEEEMGYSLSENSFTFYIGKSGDRTDAYAIMVEEMGKHNPISFIAVISPEGKVMKLIVYKENEQKGKKIKTQRFLKQFTDKTLVDFLRLGSRVVHTITGATISSKAAIRAAKKALLVWQEGLDTPL